MSSNPIQQYAVLNEVKLKLNISTSDLSQDVQITVATNDANNYIAEQTVVHATVVVAGNDPSLSSMANNLAAAYFNFWISTEKDREELERWQDRVQQYIMAKYGKKSANMLSGDETFGVTSGFVSPNAGIVPDPCDCSPLTTKGDIWGYSETDARIPVGADNFVLTADSSNPLGVSWQAGGAGSGDVVGPASATDNAIARYDGITGKLIQNSGVIIDDSDNITGVTSIAIGSGTWVISEDLQKDLIFTAPTGNGDQNVVYTSDTGEFFFKNTVGINSYSASLISTSNLTSGVINTDVAFSIQTNITTASDSGTEPLTRIRGTKDIAEVISPIATRPIFGFYNFNTKLWEISKDGNVDMLTHTLSNVTITTPTITDFTNAVHNHQAAVGGGTLIATSALTATGTKDSTTFLRGDDTWAVPSAGGSQTPWLSDIDADGFDLRDLSNLEFRGNTTGFPGVTLHAIYVNTTLTEMRFNVPDGNTFSWGVNGSLDLSLSGTELNLQANTLGMGNNTSIIWGASANRRINNSATGFVFEVENGDTFEYQIDSAPEYTFDAAKLDLKFNNLTDIGAGTISGLSDIVTPVAGDLLLILDTTASIIKKVDASKFLGITSLAGDTAAVQTLTGGTGITIINSTPDHSFAIDSTVATITGTQTLTNKSIVYAGRGQWNKGANVASAAIITLGNDGNIFNITGITTINQILAAGWQAGSVIILEFAGILTVTNNSGGINDIILGDNSNFTTAAGDSLELWFDGTDWREISRSTGIGSGITSINADTTPAQLITGVTNEIVIDSATTPGTTNISLGNLVALSSDNLSFFASTTSSQLLSVISDETGTGVLVFGTTPTLTTPAIGDFTNATHSHANTIGGSQLISTQALSDTANIAYLNTANTWSTGLQNFSAATLRIPVSTIPSVTVNGDIAFDSAVTDFSTGLIKFFGIEEQGIVSMPIAQFTTPTEGFVVTYNATSNEFELRAAGVGGGDVVGPASSTDNAITRFSGTSGTQIQNGIITIDDLANVQEIRSLEFTTHTSSPGAASTHIALVNTDFHINTTSGNNIKLLIQDDPEYEFDSSTADFNGNALHMGATYIQLTSITSPGTSGSAATGKLFLDSGNSNVLSIIRNGSVIDLESTDFPINFPENAGGNATTIQDIDFSIPGRHSQQYTLTQNTTLTFSGTDADTTEYIDLFIIQDLTGGRTLTLPVGTVNKAEVEAGINLGTGETTFILLKFAFGTFYAFLQGTLSTQTPWTSDIDAATFNLTNLGFMDFGTGSADTGTIRLQNAQTIEWEASPAGTNAKIYFNIAEQLIVGEGASKVLLPTDVNIVKVDSRADLLLEANHTTPANGQEVGRIFFQDDNSAGGPELYGRIQVLIENPTFAAEDAEMFLSVIKAGIQTDYIKINEAADGQVSFGADIATNGNNLIMSTGEIQFVDADHTISNVGTNMQYDTVTGTSHIFRINNAAAQYTMSSSKFDTQGKNIDVGGGNLQDIPNILDSNGNELLTFTTTTTAVNELTLVNAATATPVELQATGGDTDVDVKFVPKGAGTFYGNRESWGWPLTDETTAPTVGVKYTTEPAPYDMSIEDAIGGLTTAGTGVALFTIDVLKETSVNGNVFSSIFTTDLVEIDASEFTSTTAATQPNITTATWEKGRRLQLSISILDTDGLARGVKVELITHATAK